MPLKQRTYPSALLATHITRILLSRSLPPLLPPDRSPACSHLGNPTQTNPKACEKLLRSPRLTTIGVAMRSIAVFDHASSIVAIKWLGFSYGQNLTRGQTGLYAAPAPKIKTDDLASGRRFAATALRKPKAARQTQLSQLIFSTLLRSTSVLPTPASLTGYLARTKPYKLFSWDSRRTKQVRTLGVTQGSKLIWATVKKPEALAKLSSVPLLFALT